ncbi:hypothetical protein FY036_00675 [Mesorhizobium microcysteis]|uniref:Uncharacterized protein n=1 Tax=Neoaquamicrobium microcysteis TaxID=2682781 RepID=A0A5D4H817_9HYPH|nr:hypothetical protein [Mesorhizobium microcysteis]TYR36737.1 hypothetical protein FY036_00675 [Mesorhizobium microcysteis]
MDQKLKKQLQDFERQLDAALDALPTRGWSGTSALRLASELHEIGAFKKGIDEVGYIDRGYSILANGFVSGTDGAAADVESETDVRQMMEDLAFASHYYMIREYLYYSYNVHGAMNWSFQNGRVEIRFADKTIPRQFFTVHNDQVLGSKHHFRDFNHSEEILRLLKDEPEGVVTSNLETAEPLIRGEADLKLAAYFSLISPDSQIDLSGYTYEQFLSVYRMLLMKALYHRYFARAQDAVGAVYMPETDLLHGIEEDLGIGPDTSRKILKDMVYDRDATAGRVDASYFSLMREGEPDGRIVMRPHHFAIAEGLVNVLRVIAQRRPNTFLEQVSNEIGSAFVRRVKSAWEAEGFICHSEVSLREYDATLPDIDLLVISVESTLGYMLFVCELKCPVPPRWAKDQLKVLNKDSVSKAFRQVEVLKRFIQTEDGVRFLSRMLPKEGHPHFEGFVVGIEHLIITSDNAGMFFGAENTRVINFRTLERLLRRSDGDLALIQHVLRTYPEHADEALVTKMIEFQLGSLSVAYEAVTGSPLLEFPQGHWRSDPERQAMIDAFVTDGMHPFDVLEHRPPDLVVVDHNRGGDKGGD